MREVTQTLNRAFEHSLSPRAIGWRFMALRTHRSFAQIVLQETLVYRMLGAVKDFVRDSLHLAKSEEVRSFHGDTSAFAEFERVCAATLGELTLPTYLLAVDEFLETKQRKTSPWTSPGSSEPCPRHASSW